MTNENEPNLDLIDLVNKYGTNIGFINTLTQVIPNEWIEPFLQLHQQLREIRYDTISPDNLGNQIGIDAVSGEQLIETYRAIVNIRNESDKKSIQADLDNIANLAEQIAANDTTSITRYNPALNSCLELYKKHHGNLDEVDIEKYKKSPWHGRLSSKQLDRRLRKRRQEEEENPLATTRWDYEGQTDDE